MSEIVQFYQFWLFIFDKSYRKEVREEWNKSGLIDKTLILLVGLLAFIFSAAFPFVIIVVLLKAYI